MVYNGTYSGMDMVLGDPYSTLTTMYKQMRSIHHMSVIRCINISDMFLNIIIHKSLWKFCGVNIIHVSSQDPKLEC